MSHNCSSALIDQIPLSILYYNARSILPKIDALRAEVFIRKPFIICIVESWLSHDISDDELFITGYHIHRLDRDRHGGGVLMYTHVSLLYKHLPVNQEIHKHNTYTDDNTVHTKHPQDYRLSIHPYNN